MGSNKKDYESTIELVVNNALAKLNETKHSFNQNEVEALVSEITGVDEKTIKVISNTTWDVITRLVLHGHIVKLHGKGEYYTSKRSERTGRNPSTGESYPVPEREVMAFRLSPAFSRQFREKREALVKGLTK